MQGFLIGSGNGGVQRTEGSRWICVIPITQMIYYGCLNKEECISFLSPSCSFKPHRIISCAGHSPQNIPLQSVTRAELILILDGALCAPSLAWESLSFVWFSCAWSLPSRVLFIPRKLKQAGCLFSGWRQSLLSSSPVG